MILQESITVLIIWKINFQIWFKSGACFPHQKKKNKKQFKNSFTIPKNDDSSKETESNRYWVQKIKLHKKNVAG